DVEAQVDARDREVEGDRLRLARDPGVADDVGRREPDDGLAVSVEELRDLEPRPVLATVDRGVEARRDGIVVRAGAEALHLEGDREAALLDRRRRLARGVLEDAADERDDVAAEAVVDAAGAVLEVLRVRVALDGLAVAALEV